MASFSSIGGVPSQDEASMVEALYRAGPLDVSIDASLASFKSYSEGVYYDPACGTGLLDANHEVVVVGYNMLGGREDNYWIVKNSWGTGWGMEGYIHMKMWKNNCDMARYPVYPIV